MIGIFSAIGAASSWTYACYLWRQQTKYLSASQINIIKNIIAFIIFSPILFTFHFESSVREILILFVSGIIGIALGDTFYIISLKSLGTRRTLTFESASPIIAALLGSFLLNETLPFKMWLGVFIVSISLLGVSLQKKINNQDIITNINKNQGIAFALLSVLCAVVAATLSRLVLVNSDLNPFQTTEIRLFGGIIGLLPLIKYNFINLIKKLPYKNRFNLVYASFWGTNIGILLQQNVFKILPIGLGWTLLSTSPVIALFFARSEGDEVNWKNILLSATTLLGVAIALI